MKILVSTDSSCLINYELLKKNNVSIFPLNVIIDGEEYLDNVTINQAELLKAMNENKSIKTSTPAMGMVIDYFEKLFNEGYDKIIHFTISSKLFEAITISLASSLASFKSFAFSISQCPSFKILSSCSFISSPFNKKIAPNIRTTKSCYHLTSCNIAPH